LTSLVRTLPSVIQLIRRVFWIECPSYVYAHCVIELKSHIWDVAFDLKAKFRFNHTHLCHSFEKSPSGCLIRAKKVLDLDLYSISCHQDLSRVLSHNPPSFVVSVLNQLSVWVHLRSLFIEKIAPSYICEVISRKVAAILLAI
jgi:hypothetical protein